MKKDIRIITILAVLIFNLPLASGVFAQKTDKDVERAKLQLKQDITKADNEYKQTNNKKAFEKALKASANAYKKAIMGHPDEEGLVCVIDSLVSKKLSPEQAEKFSEIEKFLTEKFENKAKLEYVTGCVKRAWNNGARGTDLECVINSSAIDWNAAFDK